MAEHGIWQLLAYLAMSSCFLPSSLLILVLSYAGTTTSLVIMWLAKRLFVVHKAKIRPISILVTGAGSAQGLQVSRAFYRAGYPVIGAEFQQGTIPLHAKFSKAFKKFYPLRQPNASYGSWLFVKDIVRIVEQEKIRLWINCSETISATEASLVSKTLDEETSCATFTLDEEAARSFSSKASFLEFLRSAGLPTPEVHRVRSRAEVHNVLNEANGKKKYALVTAEGISTPNSKRVVLPRRTLSQTYHDVSGIKISKDQPYILEQQFEEVERYTTFSIIVRGDLVAFAAALKIGSTSLQAVSTSTGPGRAMLSYAEAVANRAGDITTHLSIDFQATEKATSTGFEKAVLPVSCSLQRHPACLSLSATKDTYQLVDAYLQVWQPPENGTNDEPLQSTLSSDHTNGRTSRKEPGAYAMGPAIMDLVLRPVGETLTLKIAPVDCIRDFAVMARYLLLWKEATFEIWDPLPTMWLYHVYLPLQLLIEVFRRSKGTSQEPFKALL